MTREQAIDFLQKDIERISCWLENTQINTVMRKEWEKRLEDIKGIKEILEGE